MLLSGTLLTGVLAALATPVDKRGDLDLGTFSRLIEFVRDRGVEGIVIGGATGEYASFGLDQRRQLIHEGAKRGSDGFVVVAGIGAQSLSETLSLAETANESGCRAVLLPMPYYFRYEQDDLKEYTKVISRSVKLPCLLYHIPSFTNGLEIGSVAELLQSDAGLAGIKDSSGNASNLAFLAAARDGREFDLFVGDDSLALAAFQAGWNGVISGIACFLPELLAGLAKSFRSGDSTAAQRCQNDLDELIGELVKLPIPWGVRVGLEARGISPGPLPLPLSSRREQQVAAFRDWCRNWLRGKDWVRV